MKDEESSHPSANAGQAGADGAGSRGGGFGGGNRFAWHQDFAYWTEGNPYNRPVMPSPDVATAAVAIDRSGPENGALQMLKGSHKLGLLGYVAEPWGERYAEDASVQSALAAGCDIVVCEQEPGDVCFFNCLTFRPHHFPHSPSDLSSSGWGCADCSEANTSPHPRWAFLCAYDNWANALRYSTHHHLLAPQARLHAKPDPPMTGHRPRRETRSGLARCPRARVRPAAAAGRRGAGLGRRGRAELAGG